MGDKTVEMLKLYQQLIVPSPKLSMLDDLLKEKTYKLKTESKWKLWEFKVKLWLLKRKAKPSDNIIYDGGVSKENDQH